MNAEYYKQLLDLLCDELNVLNVFNGYYCETGRIGYNRKTRRFFIEKYA
jgi:hypothetical protein